MLNCPLKLFSLSYSSGAGLVDSGDGEDEDGGGVVFVGEDEGEQETPRTNDTITAIIINDFANLVIIIFPLNLIPL